VDVGARIRGPRPSAVNASRRILLAIALTQLPWQAGEERAVDIYFDTTDEILASGVVYIGTDDNNLYAFDADSGAYLWSATTASAVDSSPAVSDGKVYVGSSDGMLYAYALNGGNNPIYHRNAAPPSYAMLHPDLRLKAVPAK
jgi:Tfp pilus tip-associated adhesin PilY1